MKINNLLIIMCFCLGIASAKAQVGIGTDTPDTSAILDLSATNKGLYIPKYNLTVLNSSSDPINNPAVGLLIYNIGTTYPKGIYYWLGDRWEKFHIQGDFDEVFSIAVAPNSTKVVDNVSTTKNIAGFTEVSNSISGLYPASVNSTTGAITLPKGKYKVYIKLDGGWNSSERGSWNSNYVYLNTINGNTQYYNNVAINALFQNSANTNITETQYSNLLVSGTLGIYNADFVFWLDLQQNTNIVNLRLYFDTLGNTYINNATTASNVSMYAHQSGLKVTFTRMQ